MIKALKIVLLLLSILPVCAMGQDTLKSKSEKYIITQNDSLVYKRLEEVDVYPRRGRNLNYRRYSRIVAKVRKVYPFALDAASELEKYNSLFENATSEKERRRYVRKVEKELFAKHEDELKRFTISEGRYLMLLIDRETGNSSYSIIRELKGGLSATFWQGVAKIFRNDLKEEYDPLYKHYVIEQIVLMIEKENTRTEMPAKQ